MSDIRVGFAMCGSFCTFSSVLPKFEQLAALGYDMFPIMSDMAAHTDTRFGKAKDFRERLMLASGREIITTVAQAEPIGPKKLLDVLIVAPCTGNTLAKLANSITDTAVTMAVKAHLRNARPVVIAVSTNDALSGSAKNIGILLNYKNIYFVPMQQDDYEKKPTSVLADFDLILPTMEKALKGEQLQPIYIK